MIPCRFNTASPSFIVITDGAVIFPNKTVFNGRTLESLGDICLLVEDNIISTFVFIMNFVTKRDALLFPFVNNFTLTLSNIL